MKRFGCKNGATGIASSALIFLCMAWKLPLFWLRLMTHRDPLPLPRPCAGGASMGAMGARAADQNGASASRHLRRRAIFLCFCGVTPVDLAEITHYEGEKTSIPIIGYEFVWCNQGTVPLREARCTGFRASPGIKGYNHDIGTASDFFIEAPYHAASFSTVALPRARIHSVFSVKLALKPSQALFHFPASTLPAVPTQGSSSPASDKKPAGRKPNTRRLACKPMLPNFQAGTRT